MRLQGLRNHVSPNKIYVNLRDSVRSFNHVKLQGLDSKGDGQDANATKTNEDFLLLEETLLWQV